MIFVVYFWKKRILVFNFKHSITWLLLTVSFTKRIRFARSTFFGFVFMCSILLAAYFIPIIYFMLNQNAFIWLFNFILNQNTSIRVIAKRFTFNKAIKSWILISPLKIKFSLLITWTLLFNASFYVYAIKQYIFGKNVNSPNGAEDLKTERESKRKNITITRKLFHLLIVIVYISGLLKDKRLLFLCSFGMLILLSLGEVSFTKLNMFLFIYKQKIPKNKDHQIS